MQRLLEDDMKRITGIDKERTQERKEARKDVYNFSTVFKRF